MVTEQQIKLARDKFKEISGITIYTPDEGTLDDFEHSRYDGLVAALEAALSAAEPKTAPSVAVEDLIAEVHGAIDEYRKGMKGIEFGPNEWPTVDGVKTVIAQCLRRSTLSAQVQDKSETVDCLLAGKPFVFDPATNFCHADDGGAPEHGIKYVPASQVQDVAGGETTTRFHIEWIAGARPPVHPKPMTGRATFETFDLALRHMRNQADDAQFVSLEERRTTVVSVDRSEDMRAILPAAPAKQEGGTNE